MTRFDTARFHDEEARQRSVHRERVHAGAPSEATACHRVGEGQGIAWMPLECPGSMLGGRVGAGWRAGLWGDLTGKAWRRQLSPALCTGRRPAQPGRSERTVRPSTRRSNSPLPSTRRPKWAPRACGSAKQGCDRMSVLEVGATGAGRPGSASLHAGECPGGNGAYARAQRGAQGWLRAGCRPDK